MADNLTPEQRRRNMSGIRSRDTKPEVAVRSAIHKLGFRFRLHCKKVPRKPDIVLPRYRKIVLVHGCFWHMHTCGRGKVVPKTNEPYWNKKRQRNVERDQSNFTAYADAGWQTLVVWECETKDIERLTIELSEYLTR